MKDIKGILDLNNLVDYVGFANTPTYLYKHFRLDDSIANLSKELQVNDLVSEFMLIMKKEVKSLDDVAILYACLFALTLKPVEEVYDIMKAMQFAPFRWVDKIATMYLSNITLDIEDFVPTSLMESDKYQPLTNSMEILK